MRRVRIEIGGAVQGVGFRPFVYRLATELALSGSVSNSPQGVVIEIEGDTGKVDGFIARLGDEKPLYSLIESETISVLSPVGEPGFRIVESGGSGEKTALVLPDIASCSECIREIFDPGDRRYRYPFTNCTHCGPRFSIVESLPYDRENTTMRTFPMCERCRSEYHDPLDRRFHAQPAACPDCGPHLELRDSAGRVLASHDEALAWACDAVRRGSILALKGLGGFQLLVDAGNGDAIGRLRDRKAREEKPFALMFPTLESIRAACNITDLERQILCSPQSPIVLVDWRIDGGAGGRRIDPSVAPENPYLGVMLPYTPLHHLVMADLERPIIATSGNLRDEPICTDEFDAIARLGSVADLFLVHNRPIANHVDDSVVRIVADRPLILRRARGYAPTPFVLRTSGSSCLAVGGHQKNCVALSKGRHVFVGQHIGDLETRSACESAVRAAESMSRLHGIRPVLVVCDRHPDYMSTRLAERLELPKVRVQHHFAHILSCMAENGLDGTVLGVAWDGSGLGLDGTVWGGEFLVTDYSTCTRFTHLRTFSLPGNERAVHEPRRSGIGLLYEIFGDDLFAMNHIETVKAFGQAERGILRQVLRSRLNTPVTSSAGRLFDAIASIIGIRQFATFEGQASMSLEFISRGIDTQSRYEYAITQGQECNVVDWEPMIRGILGDVRETVSPGLISARFHNTLVDIMVDVARRCGEKRVVLTGGCFQNKRLTEQAIVGLRAAGFDPFRHVNIPPNDGGLALGQAVAGMNHGSEE